MSKKRLAEYYELGNLYSSKEIEAITDNTSSELDWISYLSLKIVMETKISEPSYHQQTKQKLDSIEKNLSTDLKGEYEEQENQQSERDLTYYLEKLDKSIEDTTVAQSNNNTPDNKPPVWESIGKPEILASGVLGQPNSFQITASDDDGPETLIYELISGSLPDGMTFDKTTGKLEGTSTSAGTFNITILVSDGLNKISREFILGIYTAPTWETVAGSLGTVLKDQAGSIQTTAKDSDGPNSITYSLNSGSIPAGMNLNNNSGEISGTPTEGGTFEFTLRASDSVGYSDQSFSILVNCWCEYCAAKGSPPCACGTPGAAGLCCKTIDYQEISCPCIPPCD